jgi:HNH endonuclease
MVRENVQGKKFGPIGECVYCGSDGGRDGLRSEHIIPFSLGGKAEILEASCVACEAITSYIDGYLAANTYYDLRLSIPNFATRRRKRHPKFRTAQITFADREERRDFATGAHPFFTILPVWGLPGIFRNVQQPSADFPPSLAHTYIFVPEDIGDQLRLKVGEIAQIKAAIPINLATFGRALAKIAYCQAIAHYGLRGFRPLVMPDLILGKYPCIPHFVGNQPGNPPPSDRSLLHQIGFRDATLGNQRLVLAVVRLFANSGTAENGMPIYNVVVGAPR